MKPEEQIAFVRELSANIAESIVVQIRDGKIPRTWDGHELRTLLHLRHSESASMSKRAMQGARRRAFNNHINTIPGM